MELRKLSERGPLVGALGLGCMGMSEFYGPSEEETSLAVIDRALELGVTLLDTADMYGSGRNEELLCKAIRGRRDKFVLATKFGVKRGEGGSFLGISGRPEYVRASAEASLRRLGVEVIDLYYQHRVDPEVPIEETVGAMGELVQRGWVRHLGISEVDVQQLERAHATWPLAAVQNEYSLTVRTWEPVVEACARKGIAFVAYSPLGRGLLTGSVRSLEGLAPNDYRRTLPRMQPGALESHLAGVDRVGAWARARGVTAAQAALAWVLQAGPHVIAIPGTRSLTRLAENVAATELRLTAAEREELAGLS